MFFTFSAAYALRRKRAVFGKRNGLTVLQPSLFFALDEHSVVTAEGSGNINTLRTRHTVTAAGAAHLFVFADFFGNQSEGIKISFGKMACLSVGRRAAVFAYHFKRIHSRQHYCDLGLVVQPAKAPFGRSPPFAAVRHDFFGGIRQHIDQLAAAERLHNNYGYAHCRGRL